MFPHTAPLWALRLLGAAHAAMAASQPLSIGRYLDGVIGAFTWHSILGSSLIAVTMLMGMAALLTVLLGGSVWLLAAPIALFLAEGIQIGMGHSRVLAIHVPLGVVIVAAAAGYAVWLWLPRASRPRPRRRSAVLAAPDPVRHR